MRASLCPRHGQLGCHPCVERFPVLGREERDVFHFRTGTYFWSNGDAWGTCVVESDKVALSVLKGELDIKRLVIGDAVLKHKGKVMVAGEAVTFKK